MPVIVCSVVAVYVHKRTNFVDQLAERRRVFHPLQRDVLAVYQIVGAQHFAENTVAVELLVQHDVARSQQVHVLEVAVLYESAELSVHVVVNWDVETAVEELFDLRYRSALTQLAHTVAPHWELELAVHLQAVVVLDFDALQDVEYGLLDLLVDGKATVQIASVLTIRLDEARRLFHVDHAVAFH